jgi:6-pyruvoyltetrahydropterin/6-carboxytetrahydropterin synthase
VEFDAAHSLGDGYVGKCSQLHGHTYILDITIRLKENKRLDKFGFIRNFTDVKEVWDKEFKPIYDHRFLNDSLKIQTTAENICMKLFKDLSGAINDNKVFVYSIRLYETPSSFAEVISDSS